VLQLVEANFSAKARKGFGKIAPHLCGVGIFTDSPGWMLGEFLIYGACLARRKTNA